MPCKLRELGRALSWRRSCFSIQGVPAHTPQTPPRLVPHPIPVHPFLPRPRLSTYAGWTMILRKFQVVTLCIKTPRTATSGCLIVEFQPISLRIRSRPMSSKKAGSSMSLQEKIQFLHSYSACDVCLHFNRLPK